MKKELILLFLIFLITSCTEDKKQREIKQLQHEVLDFPDMMIGSSGDIQKEGIVCSCWIFSKIHCSIEWTWLIIAIGVCSVPKDKALKSLSILVA